MAIYLTMCNNNHFCLVNFSFNIVGKFICVFYRLSGEMKLCACMILKVTGQLADTPTRGLPTRGLDISRTGQLAVSQMLPKRKTKHAKSPMASASWQSASWRIGELSSNL